MDNQRKLGIYWSNAGISLVELKKDVPLFSSFVSFTNVSTEHNNEGIGKDLQILNLLHKALNSASFSISNTFFSLPSNDIIVRWFVIPWVKPDEVQGVVMFEAKKYVPFPIEDLVFNYYPSTITMDGARHIGIAFTAIRRELYQHYTNILYQTGINVVYSEPSAMSLLRALVAQKLVTTDKVTAVLTTHDDIGEISIYSQGYVKFIRDFSLRSPQIVPSTDIETVEFTRAKLFNEVRMSLDFFSRNNAGVDVQKVVAISAGKIEPLYDGMSEDINLPVTLIDPEQMMGKFNVLADIGYMQAFGVGLSGAVPLVIDFNLSEASSAVSEKKKEKLNINLFAPQILAVVGSIAFCAALAFVSWWWTNDQIMSKEAVKTETASRLGRFLDVPREDIDSKLNFLTKKAAAIRSLPLKSSITPLMIKLAQLTPGGIWFNTMDVSYADTSVVSGNQSQGKKKLVAADYYSVKKSLSISLSGYASLNDSNAEFELVNQFLESLKNTSEFKEVFTEIKIKNLQTTDLGFKQRVTSFSFDFK
ncbi:MAG: pilus assembly protein PilM [Candidatus Omnitrophica bacterium]|nr:pilus assembly protein PilM [Candidatus Omnitrophota bacterium]